MRPSALPILFALSCTPTTPVVDGGLLYTEALSAAVADPENAAVHCGGLIDPTLHADCITAAVERLKPGQAEAGARLCEELPEGTGRDECWFQLAENSADPTWCDRAGRFMDDCRLHMWTGDLMQKLPRDLSPVEAEPVARELLERHRFDADDGRPWVAVFRMTMGRRRPIDRSLCDGLSTAERQRICRDASRDLYNDLLNHSRDKGDFPCDGSPLPSHLQYVDDPGLDALVAERRAADLCPGG